MPKSKRNRIIIAGDFWKGSVYAKLVVSQCYTYMYVPETLPLYSVVAPDGPVVAVEWITMTVWDRYLKITLKMVYNGGCEYSPFFATGGDYCI
jgi:hypothetical protein